MERQTIYVHDAVIDISEMTTRQLHNLWEELDSAADAVYELKHEKDEEL